MNIHNNQIPSKFECTIRNTRCDTIRVEESHEAVHSGHFKQVNCSVQFQFPNILYTGAIWGIIRYTRD